MWSYSDLLPKTLLYQTLGISDISYLGDGVGVAIIDSGLLSDIGGVAAFYDFTQGTGAVAARAFDDYGHGSHVAGQITDPGLMSAGAYGGLAPKARLIGLKVLDKDGVGRTSDVISAIEFALAKRSSLGIDVINLSLGHPVWEPAATDPLVLAVERAVAAPALANLLCRAAAPDEREHHVGRFHRAAALAGPSSVRRRG
jgi:serine protease AprX